MVQILTFGCKVNQYESQLIKENIEKNPFLNKDEFVIINSCCVTEKVEKQIKKTIKNLIKKGKKVYLTGCLAEKIDILNSKIENVEIIEKSELFEIKNKISHFNEHTRSFVKIEDGCENFCSYCIVPFVRGKVKSRKEEEIVEEIKCLAENGYKEVVLTGIDLGSFGKDTGENLISLIDKINKIEGIKRIRLSSIEIYYIDEKLIDFLKTIKKFCPHFHIPLQSGSDRILKLMNRRYTFNQYYEKIQMIKEKIEKVTFTTDIMVGFPGEKDDDFEKTCISVERVEFLKIHIFPYSEREFTTAIELNDKVSERIKKEREKILIKISNFVSKKVKEKFIGEKLNVLFERKKDNFWDGYSENYIPVLVKSDENLKNKIVTVLPQKTFKNFLLSVIYNQKET